MRVNKSDVANSPKMFISSGKKRNMFSKFWMEPSASTSFHQKKTCFSFGQEVAFPSLSVLSHKRNLLISVSFEWHPVRCTYCNCLSVQCPFSLSLPTSQQLFWCSCQCWYYISKMNPVFSMIFHTNTITYTDTQSIRILGFLLLCSPRKRDDLRWCNIAAIDFSL